MLRIMTWRDDPELSGWGHCNKDPYKREEGGSSSKNETWKWKQRREKRFEDATLLALKWRKGPGDEERRWFPGGGNAKGMRCLLEFPERMQPC